MWVTASLSQMMSSSQWSLMRAGSLMGNNEGVWSAGCRERLCADSVVHTPPDDQRESLSLCV